MGNAAVGNWAEIRVGHAGGDEALVDHADRHWEVTPVKSNFPAIIGMQTAITAMRTTRLLFPCSMVTIPRHCFTTFRLIAGKGKMP